MKKLMFTGIVAILMAAMVLVSCKDKELDPLVVHKLKAGTMLAVRGPALTNTTKSRPPLPFYPRSKSIKAGYALTYEVEFLSDDESSLESVDLYVVKLAIPPSKEKTQVKIKTIQASDFRTSDKYTRPGADISIPLATLLELLDLPTTLPFADKEIDTLLYGRYSGGIEMRTDLNLKDGSQVKYSDFESTGLQQSTQFFPAMNLSYVPVEYCDYEADWAGTYTAKQIYPKAYKKLTLEYEVTLTKKANADTLYTLSNFNNVGSSSTIEIEFVRSTDIYDQTLKVAEQEFVSQDTVAEATGSYRQCYKGTNKQTNKPIQKKYTFTFNVKKLKRSKTEKDSTWIYSLEKKP